MKEIRSLFKSTLSNGVDWKHLHKSDSDFMPLNLLWLEPIIWPKNFTFFACRSEKWLLYYHSFVAFWSISSTSFVAVFMIWNPSFSILVTARVRARISFRASPFFLFLFCARFRARPRPWPKARSARWTTRCMTVFISLFVFTFIFSNCENSLCVNVSNFICFLFSDPDGWFFERTISESLTKSKKSTISIADSRRGGFSILKIKWSINAIAIRQNNSFSMKMHVFQHQRFFRKKTNLNNMITKQTDRDDKNVSARKKNCRLISQ